MPVVVEDVVSTVSVEVVVPGGVTEVGLRLELPQVRFPPVGWVVTEQLRVTAEENPPEGVTVMMEVLPVSAPALTVMAPLLLSA